MLNVIHLSKTYSSAPVIKDLSFCLEDQGICGFLGPNGAGKSTVMNMIAGCVSPSGGQIQLNGHDVQAEPIYAKSKIGYLPELPPVYADMSPREYLSFVARAKNIPGKRISSQVDAVLEALDLRPMQHRLICALSKGYRQRVGLAQALLGEPELLMLDEPTVGLDPQQLAGVRELLREQGKRCMVFISSHILSEIEALCDKLLIIYQGELVAFEAPDALESKLRLGGNTRLLLEGNADTAHRVFSPIADMAHAAFAAEEDGTVSVTFRGIPDRTVQRDIFRVCAENGLILLDISHDRGDLEDVFMALTTTPSVSERRNVL